ALGAWQILLNPAPYVREALGQHGAGQGGGFEIWQVDRVSGWVFYLKTLNEGLGALALLLALLGIGRSLVSAIRNRDRQSRVLLSFPLLYYLAMGSTRHYFTRYALPLLPFAALFAAQGALWISALFTDRSPSARRWLLPLLTLAAMLQPATESMRSDWILTRTDTRTLAKAWIETHIPSGARIAVDWPVHSPPLATAERPGPPASGTYDVVEIGASGLSEHDVNWYRDQGFDYVITSSHIARIDLVDQARDRARDAFYTSLDDEFEMVQRVAPGAHEPPFVFDEIYGPLVSLWHRERPGPVLHIYKVNAEPH
ncbi:MAG: hypothetical protein JXA74_09285, partial [Anaerolineae bacterium]|nr:hypothetical protein [Anaerolineae bacterium]